MSAECKDGIKNDTTVIYAKEDFKMSEKEIWEEIRRTQREDIKPIGDDVSIIKGKMSILTPILFLSLANFLGFVILLVAGYLMKGGG